MLHSRKAILEAMSQCRKLPRLLSLAIFPMIFTALVPLPIYIVFAIHSFSIFFLMMGFLEMLWLALKSIDLIEKKGNYYNVIHCLYDMEFDQQCEERKERK